MNIRDRLRAFVEWVSADPWRGAMWLLTTAALLSALAVIIARRLINHGS